MEDQISVEDKKSIYDAIYGVGSFDLAVSKSGDLKSNLNLAIAQLLVLNQKVKISKETIDKFRKIFAFLEKSLGQVSVAKKR
jgi:hypothetical protein